MLYPRCPISSRFGMGRPVSGPPILWEVANSTSYGEFAVGGTPHPMGLSPCPPLPDRRPGPTTPTLPRSSALCPREAVPGALPPSLGPTGGRLDPSERRAEPGPFPSRSSRPETEPEDLAKAGPTDPRSGRSVSIRDPLAKVGPTAPEPSRFVPNRADLAKVGPSRGPVASIVPKREDLATDGPSPVRRGRIVSKREMWFASRLGKYSESP